MVLNPAIQAKAQAQIDSVVGSNRLPVFEDLSSLPYVQAIMMEVLRYYPVTPFSTCDGIARIQVSGMNGITRFGACKH